MNEWFNIITALFAGLCLGASAGLGFNPLFKQPENLKKQLILGIIGIAFAAMLLYICIHNPK